jgi:phosphatidylserine/phosphatidylglycerophosphate/cardiolipin synthase-like enzyme
MAGPLHRRRSIGTDQNDCLPPLSAPWGDERWFRGGFPPRRHNSLLPLLHGQEYFDDLHAALLSARERVTICGWCLTPLMPLLRDNRQADSILADVLREVSSRAEVFVLLWAGAPGLFEPTRKMVEESRCMLLRAAPRVRCELDNSAPFSHDHHQKAVTIDGQVAYVGGMDLTTFQGDRWDTYQHTMRFGVNWHDVQVRLQGEVVQDVEENFVQRWNSVTGERLERLPRKPLDPSWDTTAQIVRTIPAGIYPFSPQGEFGIHHALTSAIRRAERFVYLENQYIWAPEVIESLIEAMNRTRTSPFRIVLVLPKDAYTGKYDNDEHVRLLSRVDGGRGIFHAYSLCSGGPAMSPRGYCYPAIYVHAKVSVVDDEWLSVGSGNLNRRGLATDSEMNVQSIAPEVARSLRVRLWAEHLGLHEEKVASADPIALVDNEWQTTAQSMEECVRSIRMPAAGHIRKYVPARNPASRLLDLIQGLTLEH